MLYFSFALLAFVLLADLANFATAKRLAGQGQHYLVLQRDGQVFAVGRNDYGQLGLSTTTDALLPQAMLSVTNASDLFRQLREDDKWESPVLGRFANVVRTSPVNITVSDVQSISLGSGHACFISKVGGKLYCMGLNSYGQLGMGNPTNQPTPTPVVGLAAENIASVACGYYHTCAVNAAGAMFCWGSASQLGNPSITVDSPNPVQVTGITSGAASAWAGNYNSFAPMQNGTV
ncbi:hypothetical protein BASA81_008908 [Batrachochytrium salamandrivorans]|nr:hypothetical protein BASA81_008908 [Batrachochytrium salamandrivorans]